MTRYTYGPPDIDDDALVVSPIVPTLQCTDCPPDCRPLDGEPTAIACGCPCHDDEQADR